MSKVLEYIEGQRDTVIDLQNDLVSIPALGPTNNGAGEADKAKYLLNYLRGLGFADIREMPAPDERVPKGKRPNIAAVIPGKTGTKTFWIISHMDIVPPGDLALWDSDPYRLKVEGDLLFGRGVEDNHQGLVASLIAAKAFIETQTQPAMNLGLILVSDEETGSKYGLDFVVREHSDMFTPEDLFLVPDFGTEDSQMIEVAEKSMLWLKIAVHGKQCHASTPEKGVNSLVAASAFILKLSRDLPRMYDAEDELFDPPRSTFEPTKKEANVPNVNTIPGLDVFYLDCRILAKYDLAEVMERIRSMGEEIENRYKVKIEYELVQREQAAPATEADSEIVTRLAKGIEKIYGVKARPMGVGGGTVAAFLRRRDHHAAVWSTLLGTAHQPNEHASITNIIKDAQVMASIVLE